MHWGEIVDNVDMRGEVALLSRDIVIEGEVENYCPLQNRNCDKYNYDTFGGQIRVSIRRMTKQIYKYYIIMMSGSSVSEKHQN